MHAGRETLQLVANQLPIAQWARTLAQVRLRLQASASCFQELEPITAMLGQHK